MFFFLHRRRPSGFSATLLPLQDIVSALDLWGIEDFTLRFETTELIDALDRTWLAWNQEQNAD